MPSRLLLAVLLPTLLLPACSSGTDDDAAGGAAPVSSPAGEQAPAADVAPGATLTAVVGEPDSPDAFTITLTDAGGTPITELPAGDYTIEVEDLSRIHNWRLTGPGVDEGTSVEEVETATFQVTLEPGEYTYVCDPHPSMVGEITVV